MNGLEQPRMRAGIQGDGRIIFLPHAFANGGVLLYGRIISTERESKGKAFEKLEEN
jgi:hypothetical protein